MSKEAMKLALEAIYSEKVQKAAVILEEALAKQEQGEPVAYETVVEYDQDGHSVAVTYTTPQPKQEQAEPVAWTDENVIAWCLARGIKSAEDTTQQQRKPLTDEQIDTLANAAFENYMRDKNDDFDRAFARAIEAAHGIKE